MNRDIVAALLAIFVVFTVGPSWERINSARWAELRREILGENRMVQIAAKRGVIPKGHLWLFQDASARGLLKTEPSRLEEGGTYLQAGDEEVYLGPEGGGVGLSDRATKERMRQLGTNALEVNATKGTTKAWIDGSFKKVASTEYPVRLSKPTARSSGTGS
ncbi:MAG: hypothetical protein WC899_01975 [bacterium]